MIKEFKKFITRGNVIDLAIGIIIGAAFNKIVSSLVEDIITPLISYITGFASMNGFNLADLVIVLKKAPEGSDAVDTAIKLGSFITYIIDFLLNGFVIFIIVKLINRLNETKNKIVPSRSGNEPEPEKPSLCPYCKVEIDKEATRCPHCTSEITEETEGKEND